MDDGYGVSGGGGVLLTGLATGLLLFLEDDGASARGEPDGPTQEKEYVKRTFHNDCEVTKSLLEMQIAPLFCWA